MEILGGNLAENIKYVQKFKSNPLDLNRFASYKLGDEYTPSYWDIEWFLSDFERLDLVKLDLKLLKFWMEFNSDEME